ncbi:hypothetical protein A4A49_05908 [Nicotiana attenuata]|uniref:Uncharacterized protein n=1 Tax=Nicotiana attenuata TaxID=49451 RepID=A0A1J6IQP0_NICAT|nr:hypothetical protein A4A49_05908 [Nicotiana attenuata]
MSHVSIFFEFESTFKHGNIEAKHMFDEMSTRVSSKAVEENSLVTTVIQSTYATTGVSHVAADNHSPKVFDEILHNGCAKVFVEVQSYAPINMPDEEAMGPESSKVQPTRQIEFKTFEHTYLAEIFMKPETIVELYPDKYFMENVDDILVNEILLDEMIYDDEHGKANLEFNNHQKLSQFPFDLGANFLNVTILVNATDHYVWDPGISPEFMALTGSIENMKAHALFEEVRKGSCLFEKLYDWEHVGRVEMGVEYSFSFRYSCASYKLLGESIAHLFLHSFDGAPTHLEAQYMITQLRYFRSGRIWCHYEIAYLIVVMHWLLMELIRYEEKTTRYRCIDFVCKILVRIRCYVGFANSAVLKLHQPSIFLALYTNKEGWMNKVQANFLKLEKGLRFLNLMEESKFEHINAQYVIIVYMLGRSSQFVHAGKYMSEVVEFKDLDLLDVGLNMKPLRGLA